MQPNSISSKKRILKKLRMNHVTWMDRIQSSLLVLVTCKLSKLDSCNVRKENILNCLGLFWGDEILRSYVGIISWIMTKGPSFKQPVLQWKVSGWWPFFSWQKHGWKNPRKVDTKLELWKIPSGTSPEEVGLVSVFFFWGAWLFFLLPKYNINIKKHWKWWFV